MTEEAHGKAYTLLRSDDHGELRRLLQNLPAGERISLLEMPLLFEAIELEADECTKLLLEEHADSARLSGGEALGATARRGQVEFVRLLLAAGADPNQPEWENDSDWDTLLTGSMQSMHPEIVVMACVEENFSQLDARWLNEALALGLSSRKKTSLQCLEIFGRALLARLESGELGPLVQGDLKKLSKKLMKSKSATAESLAISRGLASYLSAKAALWDELTDLVVEQEFEEALELFDKQSLSVQGDLSAELLAMISRCSGYAGSLDPEGWRAFEKLLAQGVALNGVDDLGRTALMNVVRLTHDNGALIERMVDLGADVNAIVVEENGEVKSVFDFARHGFDGQRHSTLIRDLGGKSAAELTEEQDSTRR